MMLTPLIISVFSIAPVPTLPKTQVNHVYWAVHLS